MLHSIVRDFAGRYAKGRDIGSGSLKFEQKGSMQSRIIIDGLTPTEAFNFKRQLMGHLKGHPDLNNSFVRGIESYRKARSAYALAGKPVIIVIMRKTKTGGHKIIVHGPLVSDKLRKYD